MDLSQQTDERLAAEAAQEGSDGPAFVELMARYQQVVWRVCYRLLGNEHDAYDAAQEVFVRLFTCRRQYGGKSKYSTWLHGVALRTCLSIRRGRSRRLKRVLPVEEELLHEQVSKHTSAELESIEISELLDKLDEEDRAMLILKYAEGYSYEELAALFDLSVSACKMRVSRARTKLREMETDE